MKEPSLPNYLLISGGKENTWIFTFPRELPQCEIKTASFTIWTWVALSIFYDNNRYIKCAFHILCVMSWFRIFFKIQKITIIPFKFCFLPRVTLCNISFHLNCLYLKVKKWSLLFSNIAFVLWIILFKTKLLNSMCNFLCIA